MTIQKCISSSYCAKHISPWSSVKLFIKVISNTRMRAISRLIVCKWTTQAFICHLHELTFVDAICTANENHIFYIYILVFTPGFYRPVMSWAEDHCHNIYFQWPTAICPNKLFVNKTGNNFIFSIMYTDECICPSWFSRAIIENFVSPSMFSYIHFV